MYPEINLHGWRLAGEISVLSGREMVVATPLEGTPGIRAMIRLPEDCAKGNYGYRELRRREIPEPVLDFVHANWSNFTNIRGHLAVAR